MRYVAFVQLAVASSLLAPSAQAGNARSEAHQKFVASVWKFVQEADYKSWPVAEKAPVIGAGPWFGQKTYVMDKGEWAEGSSSFLNTGPRMLSVVSAFS